LTLAFACGGGGGNNSETASLVHRLLQASTSDQGGQLETFAGELPDSLTAEPPLYPDANLIVSSRQPAAQPGTPTPDASGNISQPLLYLIVLDTKDSREKVFAFYDDALDKDAWRIESMFSAQDMDTVQFANVNDADVTGVVTIARGGNDNRTSILISMQDAGAYRRQLPRFEPDDSVPVPKTFPEDVPEYENSIITGSAFVREGEADSFLLVFITRDSADSVVSFYRDEFQSYGWTVQDAEQLGLQEQTNFRDGAGEMQGVLLTNVFARDPRYTEVNLSFRQASSREPASPQDTTPTPVGTAAATAEATPARTP
jgi:predicted enzyme related to lactoylglutathione lyase